MFVERKVIKFDYKQSVREEKDKELVSYVEKRWKSSRTRYKENLAHVLSHLMGIRGSSLILEL